MSDPRHDLAREAGRAALKVTPPLAAFVSGWTVNDWVALLTGLYVILQAAHLVWRWAREWRGASALDDEADQ